MTRQERFPDTSTFHYYNANPHNRITDDCVIRAISTGTGLSWEKVLNDLTNISIKTGYMLTSVQCYSKYLESLGWIKCKQPRKDNGKKFTGKEFCRLKSKNCIAHIGGHHIVAIINGKINDIWDSTDGCIGNYFIKGDI